MNRRFLLTLAVGAAVVQPALAAPVLNQSAPAFTAIDADGRTRSLKEFRGKTVVLEWTNQDCPYVRKHYETSNMQKLQKEAAADGAVWLTVSSSAPGKQGHVDGALAKTLTRDRGASPTAFLLDPEGRVGKAYDARTTPHMYVVDKTGKLVYMGGIDDKPTSDKADVRFAKNHVREALADLRAGRAVRQPVSKPYGCSVKY